MTNPTKKTNANAQATKNAFLVELVKAYGEGAVISHKQMLDVAHKTDYARYINGGISAIRHDSNYKVGRNQYVVTVSESPAAVRDNTAKNVAKLVAKKKAAQLPKAVRKSPAKLLEAIAPEVKASKYVDNDMMEGFEQDDSEDINSLLRTIQD